MGHNLKNRLYEKIEVRGKNECWPWTGAILKTGYGAFHPNKRAHRVVYEIENGAIPKNHDVCHTCDNRSCCNPSHLFAATHKNNMIDMSKKERSPNRKLTKFDVDTIRNMHKKTSFNYTELGEIFGVSRVQISNIVNNRHWVE